jgi:hypothetical protein
MQAFSRKGLPEAVKYVFERGKYTEGERKTNIHEL